MSSLDRLKMVVQELMIGSNNLEFSGVIDQVDCVTPKSCQDLLIELRDNPVLFIDHASLGQFQPRF